MQHVSNRIIQIQRLLNEGKGDSYALRREQSELWDKHYSGLPFEIIELDVWALKRN